MKFKYFVIPALLLLAGAGCAETAKPIAINQLADTNVLHSGKVLAKSKDGLIVVRGSADCGNSFSIKENGDYPTDEGEVVGQYYVVSGSDKINQINWELVSQTKEQFNAPAAIAGHQKNISNLFIPVFVDKQGHVVRAIFSSSHGASYEGCVVWPSDE